MKRYLTAIILSLVCTVAMAQKFAYVDSQYILEHVPEYAEAQRELNKASADWKEEIEAKYDAIKRLKDSYYAEKSLLTEDMKTRRLDEMKQKEQEALAMQVEKFGVDGELYQRREALIKPIQDQMYEALASVAGDKGYMVIFDKSSQSNMLYTNPKFDVTDRIIKAMGYKPGETVEQPGDIEEGGKGDGGGKSGTDSKSGTKSGKGGSRPAGAGSKGGGIQTNPRGGK